MENSKFDWNKAFVGFGVVTVISGIYLIVIGDYLMGFCGSAVGLMIVAQNISRKKE